MRYRILLNQNRYRTMDLKWLAPNPIPPLLSASVQTTFACKNINCGSEK